MISQITKEQVLGKVAELGPLENVFLIGKDTDDLGGIVVWYPEVGWRHKIYEKDDLGFAIYRFLHAAGVKRYDSLTQMRDDKKTERMPGWDTCADYLRSQPVREELASRILSSAEESLPAA